MMNENTENERSDNDLNKHLTDDAYISKCHVAINFVEQLLDSIKDEMEKQFERRIISNITARIKTQESIEKKLTKKKKALTYINACTKLSDLIGVRAVCFFEDDIYEIKNRISNRKDVNIVKCKDYIKHPKKNGYRCIHLILTVPVTINGFIDSVKVELQLRTILMDSWAQLSYQLCYKKENNSSFNKELIKKFQNYSETMENMNKDIVELRKRIEGL